MYIANITTKKLNNELFIQTKMAFGKAILVLFFVIIFMIIPIVQFFQIVTKLSSFEAVLGSIMLILFQALAFWLYQILAKRTNPKTILITQNELIEYSANFPFPFWNKRVFSIPQTEIKAVGYNQLLTDTATTTYQIHLILIQDKKVYLSLLPKKKQEAISLVQIIQKQVNSQVLED